MKIFFFGCWNRAGHFLHLPGGGHAYGPESNRIEYPNGIHLDGTLAPMRWPSDFFGDSRAIVWGAQFDVPEKRDTLRWKGLELPQGQFLRHSLPNGYTAISWWDRCQGDHRSACNSTVLAEGEYTSEEMVAIAREHFPHVLANMDKHGVSLCEVSQ